MERNLKIGVPPTQFYLVYGTVHMDIPGNTPSSTPPHPPPMPFFLEQPLPISFHHHRYHHPHEIETNLMQICILQTLIFMYCSYFLINV